MTAPAAGSLGEYVGRANALTLLITTLGATRDAAHSSNAAGVRALGSVRTTLLRTIFYEPASRLLEPKLRNRVCISTCECVLSVVVPWCARDERTREIHAISPDYRLITIDAATQALTGVDQLDARVRLLCALLRSICLACWARGLKDEAEAMAKELEALSAASEFLGPHPEDSSLVDGLTRPLRAAITRLIAESDKFTVAAMGAKFAPAATAEKSTEPEART